MEAEKQRVQEEYNHLVHGKVATVIQLCANGMSTGMNSRSCRILAAMSRDPTEIAEDRFDEVVTLMRTDDEFAGRWEDVSSVGAGVKPLGISNDEAVASALRDLLDARYVRLVP